MKSRTLAGVAAAIAVAATTACATLAQALTPWPGMGAPVCLAPGDQGGLVHHPGACGGAMTFGWFGSDTLVRSSITADPPTGDCLSQFGGAAAPGAREARSGLLRSGVLPGFPGCFEDPASFVWLEGAGAGERIVLASWPWFRTVVVDDGVAGTSGRHDVHMVGGESATPPMDTSAVVVWTDDRTGVAQVRAQRVGASGARLWGPAGIRVAATSAEQGSPDAVRLIDGSVLVMWRDLRTGTADVYAQRLMPDGTPAASWPAAGRALEARAEAAGPPRFARTAMPWVTRAYAVWAEYGPRFGGFGALVVRALDEFGVPLATWPDSGVAMSTVHRVESLQGVRAQDDEGGLVAAWTDLRSSMPGNDCDLYAQRLLADGSRPSGWPPEGLAICRAAGRQEDADVDIHSSGVTTFAWVDARQVVRAVYVSVRNADGSLPCCAVPPGGWSADGLPATDVPTGQFAPIIEADNSGGAFVVWEDRRNEGSTGLDLYAQAFTYEGLRADVPWVTRGGSRLLPPWPNPARGDVRLTLELSNAARVRLQVLDVSGRVVRTVADEDRPAGRHAWTWDGRDDGGRAVSPGLFFVRASSVGETRTGRLIRLR